MDLEHPPPGASSSPRIPGARNAREVRDDALRQHVIRQRQAATEAWAQRTRFPADPAAQDQAFRAVWAEATAAADAPLGSMGTAIGRILPAVARAWTGLGVANPKIWEADLKPIRGREVDTDGWLARVRAAARLRVRGDPYETNIIRTAELIVWVIRKDGVGFARQGFKSLGRLVRIGKETVRKVVRFLEQCGLLDTFNVLTREHGFVRRAENAYLIPDAPKGKPAAKTDAVLEGRAPVGASLVERLTRYAHHFGLKARAWGLNATPAFVGLRPLVGKRPQALRQAPT